MTISNILGARSKRITNPVPQEITDQPFYSHQRRGQVTTFALRPTSVDLTETTQPNCSFCGKRETSTRCSTYTTAEARWLIMRLNNKCPVCFNKHGPGYICKKERNPCYKYTTTLYVVSSFCFSLGSVTNIAYPYSILRSRYYCLIRILELIHFSVCYIFIALSYKTYFSKSYIRDAESSHLVRSWSVVLELFLFLLSRPIRFRVFVFLRFSLIYFHIYRGLLVSLSALPLHFPICIVYYIFVTSHNHSQIGKFLLKLDNKSQTGAPTVHPLPYTVQNALKRVFRYVRMIAIKFSIDMILSRIGSLTGAPTRASITV
uniref:Uncharacterized protein n=1 Tax=Heterorhabditis bacteriophora TaxID=37862 RepID=A0A1I7WVT0_HETBA